MRKALVVLLCLLITCAVLVNLAGCGCENEESQEESGTTKVEVPDVTGLTVEKAREKLNEGDLDCGVREEEVTDENDRGIVLEQDPEPGTMLTPDMTVYVTVGK